MQQLKSKLTGTHKKWVTVKLSRNYCTLDGLAFGQIIPPYNEAQQLITLVGFNIEIR